MARDSPGYRSARQTTVGRGDIVVLDKLVHACLVDAARLSGAKLRIFAHNDLNDLARKLKWAAGLRSSRSTVQGSAFRSRVLVVTDPRLASAEPVAVTLESLRRQIDDPGLLLLERLADDAIGEFQQAVARGHVAF